MRDLRMKRMEQGVPLKGIELYPCVTDDRAIQFFEKVVVNLEEPLDATRQMEMEEDFNDVGIEYHNGVEWDDGHITWHRWRREW
jgi:hypothetical protein